MLNSCDEDDSRHQASMLNMMNQPMPSIKSPHVLNKIQAPANAQFKIKPTFSKTSNQVFTCKK